jgi:prolyl-tRNA editing enzyme YbaK/EbsC (Cys-tRNA(Pro) deacylase)
MDAPSPSLPASSLKVQEAAERLGLAVAIRIMTEPTRTADEAAAACGTTVAQIVKSLVFEGATSGDPYLLLVSGKNRVNEKGIAATLGEGLTRPGADRVRMLTGFAIGGIPPLGHATPLKTYIDEDLIAFDEVWAAAGTPFSIFAVSPKALAEALKAPVIRVA